jgi:drug/metabolite transporter (DMT)-like permease
VSSASVTSSGSKRLVVILTVIGVLAIIVGVLYMVAGSSLPSFMTAGSHVHKGNHIARGSVAAVVGILALVGAWIMAGMTAPTRIGYGDAFALSAATAYASYLLVIKRLRNRLDGATATLWSAAVSAVVLALAAGLRGETLIPSTALGWTVVVLLGVVSHAIGQGLTSVAMGRAPVGLIALVLLAQPPFSALIAWLTLG